MCAAAECIFNYRLRNYDMKLGKTTHVKTKKHTLRRMNTNARIYLRKSEICPEKNEKLKYCTTLKEALASMNMPHPGVDIKSVGGSASYGHGGRYGVGFRNGQFYFIDRWRGHFGCWVEKPPTQILSMADHKKTLGDVCTNL